MHTVLRMASIIAILTSTGCVSTRLGDEQDRFRRTLLDLYEKQTMDNLIRVYNCRPIVQLAYTGITGEVTDTATAEVSGSQTDMSGAIANMFSYKGNGVSANKLSVTANPIIDGGKQSKVFVEGKIFGKDSEKWKYESPGSQYRLYHDFVWSKPKDFCKPATNGSQEEVKLDSIINPINQFLAEDFFKQFDVAENSDGDEENSDGDEEKSDVQPPGMLHRKEKKKDIPDHHVMKYHKEPNEDKGYWYYVPREYRGQYYLLAMTMTHGKGVNQNSASMPDPVLNELRLQRLSR
jgi:hypothetical protein